MESSQREIIERVLGGELDQYREIVRIYEADVYRLAAPVLGSRFAAEDVTQETFILAYDRLNSFDLNQPFRPWLLGIAKNVVRNELRRQSREAARLELYSHYVDVAADEERVSFLEELRVALLKCRERLSETAADAIRGRYDESLELDALAARLQRSVTATRQLLYRTRLSLRDCIELHLRTEGGNS